MTFHSPMLAVHGGAGTVPACDLDEKTRAAYHEGLRAALRAGGRVLALGGAALDAAIAAVKVLEDDPLFNAGRGAVLTSEGRPEMDAAVMRGRDHALGAVAGVCGPRHPVEAARLVMERSGHVLLMGAGAEAFLREAGMAFEPAAYFETARRRAALVLELDRRARGAPDTRSDADRHGTVGAVARDSSGGLAAATSTGGYTAKRPGRVGDSPLAGAGTFADDSSCAVSCTGNGEVFIRFAAAAELSARIRLGGQRLENAARALIDELGARDGEGGMIALGPLGPPVLVFNCAGMYRGYWGEDGALWTAIHREAYLRGS
jgi:L-asparaginase / beta-aspartyl-peptidase